MMETKRRREQRSMLAVHPDAAAIDIGATVHVAAVGPARDPEPVRSFGTFTGDLHRLTDWFAQCGIKTVVMESTGVYWIPIYEILEQRGFEVRVVNARDAKHVPGRKTDVSDAACRAPAKPLRAARHKTRQPNAPAFDARGAHSTRCSASSSRRFMGLDRIWHSN